MLINHQTYVATVHLCWRYLNHLSENFQIIVRVSHHWTCNIEKCAWGNDSLEEYMQRRNKKNLIRMGDQLKICIM